MIGGFQGPGDATDTGWINTHTGQPIASDSYCSFPSSVVPGYAQSLAISVASTNAGSFGYPSLELQFTPAELAAFYTNLWITFTFSVPAWTNGGYSQVYNLALNAPNYGYQNQSWTTALEMGDTNNSTPGSNPNYYFYNGVAERTMVVSLNYSSVEPTIQADIANSVATNGPSYLQMTLQGNQGGGAPISPAWYLNNVVLSQAAFGQGIIESNVYWVDNFSTNGVGPTNPTNYDYFDSSTQEVYNVDNDITNVYANWFGNGLTNGLSWSTNNPDNNPAFGSLQLNLTPGAGQFVVHHADYSDNPGISSLVYTDVEMDVRYDPSSVTSISGGTTNFGPLRIGVRPNTSSGGQDWFYYITPVLSTETNWVHIAAPLSAVDVNQQNWGELLIGEDPSIGGWNGNGTQTLYVANIKFVGPLIAAKVPPPTLTINPATPGLRIFAGSTVNTYDRATISTLAQNESWIGGSPTVTYSFSLLSYPNNNINQTMVQILPITPLSNAGDSYLGGTFPAAGNEYADYQDPNGMWLVLAPNGGGAVTATVEWKTNLPNANPDQIALTFTNQTAIGAWTWTFTGPNSGTVTPPGGPAWPFTITNGTVSTDFANPCAAVFGLQPNSTAGEGLWEDWGSVAISGTAGGDVTDNWVQQTQDFSGGVSPDGNFSAQGSANPPEIVITRNGLDAYWFSWPNTAPSTFGVVVTTNLLSGPPSTWIDPPYYSGNSDFTPPRADASVLLGTKYWTLMPYDDLPTVNGDAQPSPPAITVPLAPNAYWFGTPNYNNQYP